MKKIVAAFLTIFLIMALEITAMAEQTKLVVSSVENVLPKNEITLTVSLENSPGNIGVINLPISYDEDRLTLEAMNGENIPNGGWQIKTTPVWTGGPTEYGGVILKIKFKVKEDAPAGLAKVTIGGKFAILDFDTEEAIPCIVIPGGITVIGEDKPCEHANTEIINKKDASCTAKGYTGDTYCNDCKSTIAYGKEIDMISHEWIDDDVNDKAATCTEGGYDAQKCKNCTATQHINEVGPLNHDWVADDANDKAATCTEGGYDAEKCSRCPATRHVNEVGPLNHDWVADDANDKAATCTEGGYDAEKCSRCPATRHVNEVDPLGHDLDEDITEEATCTKPGKKDVFCKREGCDYVEEDVVIPALGHKWGSWTTVKEATEKEKGLEKRTCQREGCQFEETRETKKISKDNTFIILGGKNKDNKNGNETNPNTGATVCVGIAALVTLSGAGAVISRKKH